MDLTVLTERAVLPDWLIRMGIGKLLSANHENPRVGFSAQDTSRQDLSLLLPIQVLTETR